jgi:hypothetical protein
MLMPLLGLQCILYNDANLIARIFTEHTEHGRDALRPPFDPTMQANGRFNTVRIDSCV